MPAEARPGPTDEEIEALADAEAAREAERRAGRPPPLEGFDRWARILCYALGAMGILIGIAAIGDVMSAATGAIVLASIFLGAAVLLSVAWGLEARRAWGRPAARLVLWILVAVGILRIVLGAMSKGTITIPLEAIGAGLVLASLPAGQRRDLGRGSDRSVALACGSLYAVAALLPLVVA
ncbi:MAG TPA: hypothetical protein VIF44_02195 [Candidatus Limnocylindrales bacterium]|jgi:hypothetical protein